MTKNQVIVRLCELAEEVGRHLDNKYAHDCFCGRLEKMAAGFENFQFEQPVMDFIVNAVQDKINATHRGNCE